MLDVHLKLSSGPIVIGYIEGYVLRAYDVRKVLTLENFLIRYFYCGRTKAP